MTSRRPRLELIGGTLAARRLYYFYGADRFVGGRRRCIWFLVRSPFGRTLVAIKQNEVRVRYLGDQHRSLHLRRDAGRLGDRRGLAGALLRTARLLSRIPLLLDWHQSGDFVLMMILGGAGTILGPFVGAIIFVIGKDIISTIDAAWQILLGALFVACVLGFPKGILGTRSRLRSRGGGAGARTSPAPAQSNEPQRFRDQSLAGRQRSRTLERRRVSLEAKNVSKHFGGVHAVENVSLKLTARDDSCRDRAQRRRKNDFLQLAIGILLSR